MAQARLPREAKVTAMRQLFNTTVPLMQPAVLVDEETSDEEEADSDISDEVEIAASDSGRSDEDEPLPLAQRIGVERRPSHLTSPDGQQWTRTIPIRAGQTAARNILRHRPGVTAFATSRIRNEETAFTTIMDNAMIETIMVETNREGARMKGEVWKKVTFEEFKAFLGLLILRGVCKGHNEALDSLWSKETGRSLFRETMSLTRFREIQRFLRFDNRETRNGRLVRDKLTAVRLLLDGFVDNSQRCYLPGVKNGSITVDEQLYPYRGRCRYIQYIPSKPAKYGLKFWAACDSTTFYCWNLKMYAGKEEERQHSLGEHVVLNLTQNLRGSGLNVTVDNFFCSLSLARELLQQNMTLLGTIRLQRREVPFELRDYKGKELHSSQFVWTNDDHIQLVSYKAKQNKIVLLLSSQHSAPSLSVRDDKKPTVITQYNETKGGVDTMDQMVSGYTTKYKSRRWHVAVFCNILDLSCFNAYLLHSSIFPEQNANKSHRRRIFLVCLATSLIATEKQRRQPGPQLIEPPQQRPVAKRGRCHLCARENDRKIQPTCAVCNKFCCKNHGRAVFTCNYCAGERP